MRDLKHLLFFENLLRQANNELVQQACAEGRHAIAYNCSYIPEVLLDVEGCFGIRLRAPGCTNPDLATYYMTNRSCPYSKSILERAFEGGYNFIDALMGQECCTTMNRMEQYFGYCKLIPKENANEYYGFFDIFGKYATIMGTLLVSVFTQLTGSSSYGVLSVAVLFIIGFVLLWKMPEEAAR